MTRRSYGSYPDDPRVHRPKHGAFTQHRLTDLRHVVQQPAQLDGAEVGTDGKSGFILRPGEITAA